MNMQTQWLDQMMNDSDMSLEDNLIELEEMPENFITDNIFGKSYDEMSREEKNEAVTSVKNYLQQ